MWTFAAGVVPSGALSALASPQGRSVALNGPIDASVAAADSRVIPATLRQAWPGIGFQLDSARWTGSIQLAAPVTATVTSTIRLASLQGFAAQATLTAGQWPGPPAKNGQVPMALPATVASRLHVTVGSVLTGAPQTGGATISMRVTGLFRPGNPDSPYWALDLLPISGDQRHEHPVHRQLRPRDCKPGRVRRGAHREPGLVAGPAAGGAPGQRQHRRAGREHRRRGVTAVNHSSRTDSR